MQYPNRKVFWYAVSVTIAAFLIFYLVQPQMPNWLSAVAVVAGVAGIGFGLYRACRDWRPVGLFLIGIGLSFAPVTTFPKLIDRSPALGVLATLLFEMIAPLLTLVGVSWSLYLVYRSRRTP